MEEACTVWEGVLIDQKEESTSTDMPLGTTIHNIEITLGKGGQLARAADVVAKLIAKEWKLATLKLPSKEVRLISKNCSATVGQVGNVGVNQKSLGKMIRPDIDSYLFPANRFLVLTPAATSNGLCNEKLSQFGVIFLKCDRKEAGKS
ncbi:50S ribosomal protein L2-B, chloroplastic-like [Impatiens glandulifera]|uniref:50S ribosomal protein L2-B, chloroplastic-like n=1 Tax=Impatiens glandulifera TaxID=253017 RepID=UPI001FB12FBE|nr:50S ribosomal protein L2-B, chloroplastic-like [Impatiens glandulifera]